MQSQFTAKLRKQAVFAVIITALGISSCKTAKVSENTSDAKQDNSEIKTSGEPIISPWVFYEGSTARTMDLIHTELRISFDWEKHWVIGQATLVLKPYFYPQDFVRLDAKGFDIHKIGDLSGDSSYDYQYDGMELLIDLGREISKDDTISIKITYTAKPDEYEEGGSQAIVSDKGLFFIKPSPAFPDKPKQIWTQGETESNSKWFPTIDTPNERCTSDIYVTVDHIYSTLSNGRLVSSQVHGDTARTDHWKMELPHAPYLFMLGIGEFAKVSASSKSLEINYWVEQDYAQHAKAVFGHTPEMIAFFSDLLGVQYPWAKYDQVVVRDFVSGAMENTTAVVFNDGLQLTTREAIDINWDDIISHELFHHWFGNLVTCESWSNLPLNESFATYGEYLWINHKYGKDEADYHHIESLNNYLSEASEKQVDLIRFSYDHREDMFDSHSYDKGGLILHYLRSYVGDEAFFKALNLYLNRNKFKSVEIHDLRLAFEDITGEDLNWFFTQWFFNSGHPILEVSHRHENDTIYIGVEQMQDLTKYPLFRLPVYLDVIREGELMSFPIVVEDKEHEFKLPSKQAPEAVIFDSEHLIVGTVQHFKKPEELITQLMATAHLVSRYEAILKLLSDNTIFTDKAIEIGLLDRSPRIRALTASMITDPHAHEESLLGLLSDSSADVRSTVLTTLIDGELATELILDKALRDSSYLVQGVALDHFLSRGHFKSDSLFAALHAEDNVNIVLPIAHYLNEYKKKTYLDWYFRKIAELKATDLYYLLGLFGEYIIEAPEVQKRKSLPILADLAQNHPHDYIRLAAFQCLLYLAEVDGVVQKIAEIKAMERSPELREIYTQY